jgi:hypothetical protein
MSADSALFRIGQGYIDYWLHEPAHWKKQEHEEVALLDLEESLRRLISARDSVEDARRAFTSASSLAPRVDVNDDIQQGMFVATHNFFNEFYTTLSSMASVFSRFSKELEGSVPHRSNQKFLEWLRPRALMEAVALPLLEESRRFRTMLAHKASFPPYEWGTVVVDGLVRLMLHGATGQGGRIPEGALQTLDELDGLPEGYGWHFVAPDEDRVLAALAIQLNAIFPLIGSHRVDDHMMRTCLWEPPRRADSPPDGYPIFAIAPGTVAYVGESSTAPLSVPPTKKLKPRDIDELLGTFFSSDGKSAKRDASGDYSNQ